MIVEAGMRLSKEKDEECESDRDKDKEAKGKEKDKERKGEKDKDKEAKSKDKDKECESETECDGDSESDEKDSESERLKSLSLLKGPELLPEKSKEQGPIAKKNTDRGSQSLDSECEDMMSDKDCDYVITRNRQIELNGITFMHQIHGRKISKYESACLQYMRIFKEQARKEDKD